MLIEVNRRKRVKLTLDFVWARFHGSSLADFRESIEFFLKAPVFFKKSSRINSTQRLDPNLMERQSRHIRTARGGNQDMSLSKLVQELADVCPSFASIAH